jgi:hypothetical protein
VFIVVGIVTAEKVEPEFVLRSSVVVLAHGKAIIEPSLLIAKPVTSELGVELIVVGELPQFPIFLTSFVVHEVPPSLDMYRIPLVYVVTTIICPLLLSPT